MATITEQLVWSSDVSNTGVSNPENTTASDDSRNTMTTSLDWTFELTNLTYTPTSIIHVQPKIEAKSNAEGGSFIFLHKILQGDNTELYSEGFNASDDEDNSNSGATRTTSDGSSAWTENDINTLRIRFDFLAGFGGASQGFVDHYYVEVKYNYNPPPAGKITIAAGKVTLAAGKISIAV